MSKTTIEWATDTWNPVRGCSAVSEGCRNCYAMRVAHRFSGPGMPYHGLTRATSDGPKWTGDVRLVPELLDAPLRWKKPRRIFVNSMSDLFHERVPDEFIASVWYTMASAPQHIYQILTKRPKRMAAYVTEEYRRNGDSEPFPHVWLGTSVEDQKTADERIPHLLATPAAVRWISAEPLLGPIDLTQAALPDCTGCRGSGQMYYGHEWKESGPCPRCEATGKKLEHATAWDPSPWFLGSHLHWVVTGGESGPGSRPLHPDWARSLRDQCAAAGVPFFFKQWGDWMPKPDWNARGGGAFRSVHVWPDRPQEPSINVGKKAAGRLLDGRQWNEYPEARQ